MKNIICITDEKEAEVINAITNKKVPYIENEKGYYYRNTKLINLIRTHLNKLKEDYDDFDNKELIENESIKVNHHMINALRYVTNDKIIFKVKQESIFINGEYIETSKEYLLENRNGVEELYKYMLRLESVTKKYIEDNKEYTTPLSKDDILK